MLQKPYKNQCFLKQTDDKGIDFSIKFSLLGLRFRAPLRGIRALEVKNLLCFAHRVHDRPRKLMVLNQNGLANNTLS